MSERLDGQADGYVSGRVLDVRTSGRRYRMERWPN